MEGNQQLFLMEFLVDRVNIPAVRAIHEEMLPVTTCVSFQILGLPPINIYEEASTDGCACTSGDAQIFKKGKSCLFALPTNVLQKPVHNFPVTMSVYKKLPPGVLPDVMLIGSHQIQLKDLINTLLSERVFKNDNSCKAIKSTYRISTATGQSVGEVTVFIRVSFFGKKIITQFQIPHNKKPYLFKGTSESPVFQCKRIPSEVIVPQPAQCVCSKKGAGERGEPRTCCTPAPCPPPSCPPPSCPPPSCPPPDCGARPCCPSKRGAFCPRVLSPPCASCCAPDGCPPPPPSPGCCPPPPCPVPCPPPPPPGTCAPCCGVKDTLASLLKETPRRKCGCTIKESQNCSCRQVSC